jgi:hypothetical protein
LKAETWINSKLPFMEMTSCLGQLTSYPGQITSYCLGKITSYPGKITSYLRQITSYPEKTTSYPGQITSYTQDKYINQRATPFDGMFFLLNKIEESLNTEYGINIS